MDFGPADGASERRGFRNVDQQSGADECRQRKGCRTRFKGDCRLWTGRAFRHPACRLVAQRVRDALRPEACPALHRHAWIP